jgi:hypothetical protein
MTAYFSSSPNALSLKRFFPPAVSATFSMVPLPAARLRSAQDQKRRRSLAHYYNLAKTIAALLNVESFILTRLPMDATIGHFQFDG